MADVAKENGRKFVIDGGRCYTGTHVKWKESVDTPGWVNCAPGDHQYELGIDPEPHGKSATLLVRLNEDEMLATVNAWMNEFMQRREQARRAAPVKKAGEANVKS